MQQVRSRPQVPSSSVTASLGDVSKVEVVCRIEAPIERCFDLARSVDLHKATMAHTSERAVAGVTAGLIGMGEQVTFSAVHFGLRLKMTSRLTLFDAPFHFRDSQVKGPFRRFDHDHLFEHVDGVTVMTDVFDFDAPLGPIGSLVDRALLARYMNKLLAERGDAIRRVAESDEWGRVLGESD